jgi:formylglycine-generating enzyme required for sulfatase activity
MRNFLFIILIVLTGCVSSNQGAERGSGLPDASKGDTWKEPITGMVFVWVPAGCFNMGSDLDIADHTERPVHKVCLDGFWIGKYEVTQGQWMKIMKRNPSKDQGGDHFPVESISWNDAKSYNNELNQKTGLRFRLLTEAEWEYAARSGGKDKILAGGDNINRIAWHSQNSGRRIREVGTKLPNDFGLHDMNGNVLEWCEDIFDRFAYSKHPQVNPLVVSDTSLHVLRGGSWKNYPSQIRVTRRYRYTADYRLPYFGLRLCLTQINN